MAASPTAALQFLCALSAPQDLLAGPLPPGVELDRLLGEPQIMFSAAQSALPGRRRGLRRPEPMIDIALRLPVLRGRRPAVISLAKARVPVRSGHHVTGERVHLWRRFGRPAHHTLAAIAGGPVSRPTPGSGEHWLTQHEPITAAGAAAHHPLLDWRLAADFEELFGPQWGALNDCSPTSACLITSDCPPAPLGTALHEPSNGRNPAAASGVVITAND